MAALRSLEPEEREEVQRDLDVTIAQHAKLRHGVAALRLQGEPADSSFLRKLQWQIDACVRWIARYRELLGEEASA